jgi:hypothetical protein
MQNKLYRICNAFSVVQNKFTYFGGFYSIPYFLLQFMNEEVLNRISVLSKKRMLFGRSMH